MKFRSGTALEGVNQAQRPHTSVRKAVRTKRKMERKHNHVRAYGNDGREIRQLSGVVTDGNKKNIRIIYDVQ